jgi:hypothetical protein
VSNYLPVGLVNKFLDDFHSGKVKFSSKEIGSGGDERFWNLNHDSALIKKLLEKLKEQKNISLKDHDVTAMYNIIPADGISDSGDGWHFDSRKGQIKLFCYLSDVVSENNGPISFLRFSNFFSRNIYKLFIFINFFIFKTNRLSDVHILFFKNFLFANQEINYGKKGFFFMEDTSYPHKGSSCKISDRHALTLYIYKKNKEPLDITKKK